MSAEDSLLDEALEARDRDLGLAREGVDGKPVDEGRAHARRRPARGPTKGEAEAEAEAGALKRRRGCEVGGGRRAVTARPERLVGGVAVEERACEACRRRPALVALGPEACERGRVQQ